MTAIIPRDELEVLQPVTDWAPGYVLELGNKKNSAGLYRHWYEEQGCEYQCIDWNGLDGAIQVDMGKPLSRELFDRLTMYSDYPWPTLVTNFGFTEHVYTDQRQCWINVVRLVAPDSYFVFCMPNPGDWEHHGIYQPHLDWYRELAERNAFVVQELFVNRDRRRPTICGRFKRIGYSEIVYVPSLDSPRMHITPRNSRASQEERGAPV